MSLIDNIPVELKKLNQWVCYKNEIKDGTDKVNKVPYNNQNISKADITQSDNYDRFESVKFTMEAFNIYDGIGFVFTNNDPYCGIDLDNCIDNSIQSDNIFDKIDPWAKDIIIEMDSYTEVSPSGSGVHIIIKGDLPSWSKKRLIKTLNFMMIIGFLRLLEIIFMELKLPIGKTY
mgnify:CR=1 FL=1